MLVGSVAGVDYRYVGHLAGVACSSLQIVTHHDDVGIVAYHFDGIFQRFSLAGTGCFGVAESDDARPQAVGGRLKAETGAGRRLEEQGGHHLSLQQSAVRAGLKLFRHFKHVQDFLLTILSNGH